MKHIYCFYYLYYLSEYSEPLNVEDIFTDISWLEGCGEIANNDNNNTYYNNNKKKKKVQKQE